MVFGLALGLPASRSSGARREREPVECTERWVGRCRRRGSLLCGGCGVKGLCGRRLAPGVGERSLSAPAQSQLHAKQMRSRDWAVAHLHFRRAAATATAVVRTPCPFLPSPRRAPSLHRRPDGGFELSLRTQPGAAARHVHFTRGTPVQFAAVLPGDGVAETVLTSGLNSFL